MNSIDFSVEPGKAIYSVDKNGIKNTHIVEYFKYNEFDLIYFDENDNEICNEDSIANGCTYKGKLYFDDVHDRDYFAKYIMSSSFKNVNKNYI